MTRLVYTVMLAAILLCAPRSESVAQDVRLLFTSMSPGGSDNSAFFAKWAQRVTAQASAAKIEIRDGGTLANFSNVYDRVRDDVAQIGWAIHQVIGGRFPVSEVAGIPFLASGGPEASVALWRLYKSGMLDAEYKDVVPLFFAVLPPAYLHFAKTPKSIEDLDGMKIAVSGRLPSSLVTSLNGTPVSMNTGQMYEALQRGTVDGAMISWGGFDPYNLHEVTTYHVEAPLGQATSMFFMSRAKYDALPPNVRKAIDDNSGEAASIEFGDHFLQQGLRSRAKLEKNPRHTILGLTPELTSKWEANVSPLVSEWAKQRPNGEAAIKAYREIYTGVVKK